MRVDFWVVSTVGDFGGARGDGGVYNGNFQGREGVDSNITIQPTGANDFRVARGLEGTIGPTDHL